jgi:hypothetical protein
VGPRREVRPLVVDEALPEAREALTAHGEFSPLDRLEEPAASSGRRAAADEAAARRQGAVRLAEHEAIALTGLGRVHVDRVACGAGDRLRRPRRGCARRLALLVKGNGLGFRGESSRPLLTVLAPALLARVEIHAHGTPPWGPQGGHTTVAPCQEALPRKSGPRSERAPETTKTPQQRGFQKCAEEDSNLRAVIPD